jgi:hypothetical protein
MKMNRRSFLKTASLTTMLSMFAPTVLLGKIENNEIIEPVEAPIEEIKTSSILRINSVDVGEINSMTQRIAPIERLDILPLEDHSDDYQEYQQAMRRDRSMSEIWVGLDYSIKSYDILRKGFESIKIQEIEIIVEETHFIFQGHICSIETEASPNNQVIMNVMIKIDSRITIT